MFSTVVCILKYLIDVFCHSNFKWDDIVYDVYVINRRGESLKFSCPITRVDVPIILYAMSDFVIWEMISPLGINKAGQDISWVFTSKLINILMNNITQCIFTFRIITQDDLMKPDWFKYLDREVNTSINFYNVKCERALVPA